MSSIRQHTQHKESEPYMPSDIPTTPLKDAPTIQVEYIRRLDDDLARNSTAQAEAQDAIQSWQERLAELEQEAAWLLGLKSTVAGQPTSPDTRQSIDTMPAASSNTATAAEGAAEQAVPAPRRARGPRSNGTEKKATTARRPAARKPRTTASGAPTLNTLVLEVLQQHHQPRTAAEVTAELAEAHPERKAGNPVVRNSLEQLVAKSRVARTRQGRAVFYTAADESEAAGGGAAEAVTTE
ncbi:BlaI/MecI/CopY family transcriptional regulator [Streptomyces sp. NPDC046977]|uniref:BlaI/MecI/CopY family transcriptional regulator n=1 Tax=Streptomyces sp. NPDC046977 TaxID=3154703 RepID=UPI0033F82FFC